MTTSQPGQPTQPPQYGQQVPYAPNPPMGAPYGAPVYAPYNPYNPYAPTGAPGYAQAPYGQPGYPAGYSAPPTGPAPEPTPPAVTLVETASTLLPEPRLGQKASDVARLLTADLLLCVQEGWLNLAHALGVPTYSNPKRLADVYLQQPHLFVELLANDLERLLEDELVSGVHLAFVAPDGWRRSDDAAAQAPEVTGALLGRVTYQRSGVTATGAFGQREGMGTRASARRSSRRRSSGMSARRGQTGERALMSSLIDELNAQPQTHLLLLLEWNPSLDPVASSPSHRPTYLFEWLVSERGSAPLSCALYHEGAFHMQRVALHASDTMLGQLM